MVEFVLQYFAVYAIILQDLQAQWNCMHFW